MRSSSLALGCAALVGFAASASSASRGQHLEDRSPAGGTAVTPPRVAVAAFDTTATIPGRAWFQGMYDRGFRLYVMHSTAWGTCTPWSETQSQLANALSVGLKVAAYTRDPRCWRQGIEAAGPYASQLQFFVLISEFGPSVAVTREMVDGVIWLGVRPVIYTGWGMWAQIQGFDDKSFSDVPLWDTNVTGTVDPGAWTLDLNTPVPVAYGGWNTPENPRVMVQQAWNVLIDGVVVDLDSVDAAFLR